MVFLPNQPPDEEGVGLSALLSLVDLTLCGALPGPLPPKRAPIRGANPATGGARRPQMTSKPPPRPCASRPHSSQPRPTGEGRASAPLIDRLASPGLRAPVIAADRPASPGLRAPASPGRTPS